jgi:hypothetical protein
LLTWRFLAAIGALVLLAIGVDAAFFGVEKQGDIAVANPATFDAEGNLIPRRIDLIEPVAFVVPSPDFEIGEDGLTVGVLDAVIDAERTARVAPGTPGEVTCANFDDANRCVLVADVLGNAVVWFALMPRGPRETVELPPIVDLQDGYARFVNGWEVLYAPVIERDAESCGDDVVSFSDFLRRFGPGSTTVVDLETRQVTAVICGEEFVEPPPTVVYEGSLDGSIVTPSSSTLPVLDPDVAPPES